MKVYILFVLSTLFVLNVAQRSFYADSVTISNIPSVSGSLSAKVWYDYDRSLMRIDYAVGVTQIYNYTDRVMYKKCGGTCNAESINYAAPKFFAQSGEGVNTCSSPITRSGGNNDVVSIGFNAQGQVCYARYGNGQTFTFKSFSSGAGDYSTTGCPKKQCTQKLDIMVIMDESGSIDSNEWSKMKNFAVEFTKSFQVSESVAKIGLVAYSNSAVLRFAYQNDQTSFTNTMTGLKRYFGGGSTYTNSALTTTKNAYDTYARKGGVKHITVVITDGYCTCSDSQLRDTSEYLKRDNVGYVFAVGVDGADSTELNLIASGSGGVANINGKSVKTSFFVQDWDKLNTLLADLIDATCTEFPGNPCGAGCKGFCGCNQECLCPDDCSPLSDFCNNGVCNNNANGAGCYSTPKPDPCNDNNKCTNEFCSSTTQKCEVSDVVCPDKACFIKSCDPTKGCVYTPKDCSDSDPCTNEKCDEAQDRCVYPTQPCDACQRDGRNATTCQVGNSLCEKWDCVQTGVTSACQKVDDVNCDDLNECTVDSCDRATGQCVNTPRTDCTDDDACTINSCDPTTGCTVSRVNATEYCDDRSLCTIDTCDKALGCVHTNITCNTTNPCLVGVCNSAIGCTFPALNCADLPENRGKLGDCLAALCNDGSGLVNNVTSDTKLGCYLKQNQDTTIDGCGVCNGDGQSRALLTVAEIAGISAAVIGLVVGGIAAFLIAGAIGAKKGYDAYMRNKNNMSGAQSNPMYNDNGRSGQNPMYEMK